MSGLAALSTNRNSFGHFLQSLRPVLGIGGLDCEISQFADLVRYLLLHQECVDAIPISLRLGIMNFVQSSRQVIKSFRLIWIDPKCRFPVRDGISCFSR